MLPGTIDVVRTWALVTGMIVVVALADPAPDLVDELRARLPYPLRLVLAEPTLVQHVWDELLAGRAP